MIIKISDGRDEALVPHIDPTTAFNSSSESECATSPSAFLLAPPFMRALLNSISLIEVVGFRGRLAFIFRLRSSAGFVKSRNT